jgi:hypothetical protein
MSLGTPEHIASFLCPAGIAMLTKEMQYIYSLVFLPHSQVKADL